MDVWRGLIVAILFVLASAPMALSRTWIYTFVSADHGGDLLLPHFINYYHQLGITYRRFLILVHHTPGKWSREGLQRITGICQGYALECRIWEGQYTPDAHLEHQLTMLRDFILEPMDWIVVADVDELQEWQSESLPNLLQDLSAEESVTYVTGSYVERMAFSKHLQKVIPVGKEKYTPSLFTQFPLQCTPLMPPGTPEETVQARERVVAFKAYLRAGRGRRRIITPDGARSYFSPCNPGHTCPRGSLDFADSHRDLFNLTPYAWYENRYRYIGSPENARGRNHFWPYHLNAPRPQDWKVFIHHFKWHTGMTGLLGERLQRYKGTCRVGKDVPGCQALIPGWQKAASLWRLLRVSSQIETSDLDCEMDPVSSRIDTSYMGLAWEEFEKSLKVESRVRNKVRGDSQTRLAGMLEGETENLESDEVAEQR